MGKREISGTVAIGDIGDVFSGLILTRIQADERGAVSSRIVSLKDVGDQLAPISELDDLVLPAGQAGRYALAVGDVVVTARTAVIRAAVVRPEHAEGRCVLGANLFAIRLRAGTLAPMLLATYLRIPETQALLLGRRRGATVPGMTTADLCALRLSLPEEDKQRALDGLLELSLEHRAAVMRAMKRRSEACSELEGRALAPGWGR